MPDVWKSPGWQNMGQMKDILYCFDWFYFYNLNICCLPFPRENTGQRLVKLLRELEVLKKGAHFKMHSEFPWPGIKVLANNDGHGPKQFPGWEDPVISHCVLEEKWCNYNIISAGLFKITEQPSSENRFSDLEDNFCPLISSWKIRIKTLERAKTQNCHIQAFCP